MSRHQRGEARAWRALARTVVPALDAGHADQVLDRVTAAAARSALASALAELSDGDREVMLLVALGDLSHAEVAVALGIPYGTVGSRLNRARRKLRAALACVDPTMDQDDQEDQDNG